MQKNGKNALEPQSIELNKQLKSAVSGMWRLVDLVWTDVSEELIASIFRVEKSARAYFHLLTLVPRSRIFLPWRWRRYAPPKRRFTQDIHGATSQKTAFLIVTAMKTWNPTNEQLFTNTGRQENVYGCKKERERVTKEGRKRRRMYAC
jgi:hypothetical protein